MIDREIPLEPGLRLYTSSDWLVAVERVTSNGIVQWTFAEGNNPTVFGAPVEWVYRAWTLA